jgi:O-antigen/teichoic acid export membrane protein
MYPAASRMDGLNDRSGLKELYFVCTKLALLLGLPLCLGFIFLGRQFITLWMGRDYIFSATILSVLTIPQFTSMPQYSSSLILASMARHKALAYMVLAEGIVNLALSIVLVQKMGIIGVAWGTVIPHFINTGIIIPLYTLRIMNIGISEYLQKAVVRPILCAIPVGGVCYVFSVAIHNPTWLIFVAEAGVVCLVSALMAYFTSLNREQQLAIRGKTAEVFSKVSACI